MINHPKTPRPADPAASNTHIHISKNIPPEYYFSPEELQLLSDPSNPLVISQDLSQYGIQTPFMILLETCREQDGLFNMFQFTQHSYRPLQLDKKVVDFTKKRPLHRHSCIEIMYVLQGCVTNHVENQVFTYEAGECCIMNKNIRHSEDFTGDFQVVFLMMRDDFIAELLAEYYEMAAVASKPDDANLVLQLFQDSQNRSLQFDKVYLDCFPVIPADRILEKTAPLFNSILHEIINLQPGSLFYIKGAFSRLLQLMTDPGLFSINRIHSESDNQEYLFSKITHIMKSSHGRCTREELSSQLHYNGEYLNRIIKKYTGKTILEYGQSVYLEEARTMLAGTDKSISAIIDELGFSNTKVAAAILGLRITAVLCNSLIIASSSLEADTEFTPKDTIFNPLVSVHFFESTSFNASAISIVCPGRAL